jgi:transposase
MAMGKRKSAQAPMWVVATDLPVSPGHPFYTRLNTILDEAGFDRFAEAECAAFYAPVMGRPSLPPGRYFRLLLVGYFEGIDSERGIAWRVADSLALRSFLGLGVDAAAPDHSNDLADAAADRRRDASGRLHVGPGAAGDGGTVEGADGRD